MPTDRESLRILYAVAEAHPTHRADIKALFGKYLPRFHISSDLVTIVEGEPTTIPPWPGGDLLIKRVNGGALKLRIYTFFHILFTLIKTSEKPYAAIQVRDMPIVAFFGHIIARLKGLKFFYWMSYPIPEGQIQLAKERKLSSGLMKFLYPYISGYLGKFILYSYVVRFADHVFVQSDVMKQEMVARGYSPDKFTPVPMGVDLDKVDAFEFSEIRDQRFNNKTVLVYLGILERARKIWVLFDMLEQVIKVHPDTILIMAGDTPDTDHRIWLQNEAARRGLEDAIVWTGWLEVEDAWNYVKQADIALSPYPRGHLLDSASPTKVAEYMAMGIPTVANDQPDQLYTLQSSGAGICVEYTGKNFADAVIQLIEDVLLRKRMAEAGPQWVRKNRSYATIAEELARTYRSIL